MQLTLYILLCMLDWMDYVRCPPSCVRPNVCGVQAAVKIIRHKCFRILLKAAKPKFALVVISGSQVFPPFFHLVKTYTIICLFFSLLLSCVLPFHTARPIAFLFTTELPSFIYCLAPFPSSLKVGCCVS